MGDYFVYSPITPADESYFQGSACSPETAYSSLSSGQFGFDLRDGGQFKFGFLSLPDIPTRSFPQLSSVYSGSSAQGDGFCWTEAPESQLAFDNYVRYGTVTVIPEPSTEPLSGPLPAMFRWGTGIAEPPSPETFMHAYVAKLSEGRPPGFADDLLNGWNAYRWNPLQFQRSSKGF